MTFSIKDWPEHERPRERLLRLGASQLSDAELLAIFLRSGSTQHSAVDLARRLIQHFGQLQNLLNAPLAEFTQFHGLGPSKYSQLMAVKELAKRYMSSRLSQTEGLTHSQLVQDYLRMELAEQSQEVFAVLCLDAELRKLDFKVLFSGAPEYCPVSINHLLRYVIQIGARHVIIAHNHPQASVQPSAADLALTAQIHQALCLIDIRLIDHVIVNLSESFSMAEYGLMPKTQTKSQVDKNHATDQD